ncbi:MAG: alanine racemase [Eubacteriales bacterium]|nr:alanine racemase [Eubacteriales bacterium]MDD4390075.1 alanine racemase [Eubacteriales bacterium]
MGTYPQIEINLTKLKENIQQIKSRCNACGINIAGVVKGVWSDIGISKAFDEKDLEHIASSRIDQLRELKEAGIKTPLMLIRTPMLSEIDEVIRYSDISLQSEIQVIEEIEREAQRQNTTHDVILMYDIGDLREGFFQIEELTRAAILIENSMERIKLAGIGTNLGCYGALDPTYEKLSELAEAAEHVEGAIGRRLKYVSGGSTSSFVRVLDGKMPERINHLRLGEILLISKDQQLLRGYTMPFMHTDAITFRAEIIEIKEKPSLPQGDSVLDSFGNRPVFEDKGIMKRALIAVGQADYGSLMYGNTHAIIPTDESIEVISASSDHTIINITNAEKAYKVGDTISFKVWYTAMLHLFGKKSIEKLYTKSI